MSSRFATAHLAATAALAFACSSQTPVGAEIEVVSVEPRIVPPEVDEVSILFRTTRAGALRVEGNDLPEADQVVARVDDVAAGGLASVRLPRAPFSGGSHLVTLVLAPSSGAPPVRAEASFYVGEADPDGGVPPPDGGGPSCADECAGEPTLLVCGHDGRTYENRCLLECAGVTELFEGDCDDPQGDCVQQCMGQGFEMVCGEDGQTYMNQCQLDCEGVEEDHWGPCF